MISFSASFDGGAAAAVAAVICQQQQKQAMITPIDTAKNCIFIYPLFIETACLRCQYALVLTHLIQKTEKGKKMKKKKKWENEKREVRIQSINSHFLLSTITLILFGNIRFWFRFPSERWWMNAERVNDWLDFIHLNVFVWLRTVLFLQTIYFDLFFCVYFLRSVFVDRFFHAYPMNVTLYYYYHSFSYFSLLII